MNAFTVNLEDWFCSHNLKGSIRYEDWDTLPSRIEFTTDLLLEMLEKNKTKATFFVLGWIADRFPNLIKTIAREGHEIGTRGYSHTLLTEMSEDAFARDLRKSIGSIYSACKVMPKGYRAPAFTLVQSTQWALPILEANGIAYDSSIYPINIHPDYGVPNGPMDICQMASDFIEIPMSCVEYFGLRVPCSGGAYLRFFPYWLFKNMVNQVIRSQRSFIFYIHPWELDHEMPRVKLPLSRSIRHHTNIQSNRQKVENLLKDFEFTSIAQILNTIDRGIGRTQAQEATFQPVPVAESGLFL